ncbi:hypothetical protein [Flavobacterium sp. ACN6]|uniref:hypothetical protein n=1 Tax=Flavobacterium sp. ACN6 TaxID=1920426 RepID=UPI000BB36C82|nr:hypothetical protein [Flavobacterium sp. ACN6]PBJ13711.1 hypothetical protein BSF42_11870 [Flavobacterium sp. ACN6]
MENFILIILIACVIILFNNFSKLKRENELLDSLYQNIKDDYKYLKKELEEIKKQITKPDFAAVLPPKIDEAAIIPDPAAEVSPPIIPDPVNTFEDTLQNENTINDEVVEKPVFSFDSQVIPVFDANQIAEEKQTTKPV